MNSSKVHPVPAVAENNLKRPVCATGRFPLDAPDVGDRLADVTPRK